MDVDQRETPIYRGQKRPMKIQERRILKETKQGNNELVDTIVADFLQNLNKSFSECMLQIYSKPVDLPDFDTSFKCL